MCSNGEGSGQGGERGDGHIPSLSHSDCSRRCPHRLTCFHTFLTLSQEMKLVVPNSQRINRGGMILNELVETCRSHAFTDIVVLHEHRGEPGRCGRETGKCGEREEGWKCGA